MISTAFVTCVPLAGRRTGTWLRFPVNFDDPEPVTATVIGDHDPFTVDSSNLALNSLRPGILPDSELEPQAVMTLIIIIDGWRLAKQSTVKTDATELDLSYIQLF